MHFSPLCAVNPGNYDSKLKTQIISVSGTPPMSWQKVILIELE